jgi:hypothetical protein
VLDPDTQIPQRPANGAAVQPEDGPQDVPQIPGSAVTCDPACGADCDACLLTDQPHDAEGTH